VVSSEQGGVDGWVVLVDDEPLAQEDEYDVNVTLLASMAVISAETIEVKEVLDGPADEGENIQVDTKGTGGTIGMSNKGS
jgi:hypothetical protein